MMIAVLSMPQGFSQPPEIEWDRTYGGDSADVAYSVIATSEGRFLLAGCTSSFGHGEQDVYLVETDSVGDTLWTRAYGESGNDEVYCLHQTSDGGYILVGNTYSYGNGIFLIKTDNLGDTSWTRVYEATHSISARSGQQTTDEGYVVAGYVRASAGALREMFLMKTDSMGDSLWTHTYGGSADRAAFDVHQTSDRGYVLVGFNPFYGAAEIDIYLVKTDSMGNRQWTRSYGGPGEDYAVSVRQTGDSGYIIAGSTEYLIADIYVIKTDSLGDTLWTRTYGGPVGESASSIRQTSDGGYIIAGMTTSFGAVNSDMYLVKINAQGDTLWTLVHAGEGIDYVTSLDVTTDGGYIVAGFTRPEYFDPPDAWLVKTGPDTSSTHAPSIEWVSHPKDFVLHPAYPNPFNPVTTISFDMPFQSKVSMNIYNILGERVAVLVNGYAAPGNHQLRWDAGDSPSGIYFVRMETREFQQTAKVVLLK